MNGESHFRAIADCVPWVMLWLADEGGRCTFFNRNWLEFTGRSLEEQQGDGWTRVICPEDAERCAQLYVAAVANRRPVYLEYGLRRHDGSYRRVASHAVPRFSPAGDYAGYVGGAVVIADCHAAGNAEDVALMVSHDLQGPLRAIAGFAKLLDVRYADRLGADAQGYVQHILSVADHLGSVVQEFLDLGRNGGAGPKREAVECGAALAKALEGLSADIEQRRAIVEHADLPRVHGVPALITQVFANLIANAIKFAARPPVVVVSAERSGEFWTLRVRDNGIGIPADKLGFIFEPFHRLNGNPVLPGSGLGLKTCWRIVAMHGGRIWAHSSPGLGSTFYFTLPAVPDAFRSDTVAPGDFGARASH